MAIVYPRRVSLNSYSNTVVLIFLKKTLFMSCLCRLQYILLSVQAQILSFSLCIVFTVPENKISKGPKSQREGTPNGLK